MRGAADTYSSVQERFSLTADFIPMLSPSLIPSLRDFDSLQLPHAYRTLPSIEELSFRQSFSSIYRIACLSQLSLSALSLLD